MNKKQILFSALFLTFACASAGAAPPEPSALGAFCPPSEGKSFHSGWISLGLKAADLKEKQASAGHITDVGEAQVLLHFPAGWKPQDKRTALCIFPGGGYSIQAIEKEGCRIAGWAAEHGMVGVIVKYRVSGTNNAVGRFPGPCGKTPPPWELTLSASASWAFPQAAIWRPWLLRCGTAPFRKKRKIR